jgi:hypothetical protein
MNIQEIKFMNLNKKVSPPIGGGDLEGAALCFF